MGVHPLLRCKLRQRINRPHQPLPVVAPPLLVAHVAHGSALNSGADVRVPNDQTVQTAHSPIRYHHSQDSHSRAEHIVFPP